jgi:hypothetical protein
MRQPLLRVLARNPSARPFGQGHLEQALPERVGERLPDRARWQRGEHGHAIAIAVRNGHVSQIVAGPSIHDIGEELCA